MTSSPMNISSLDFDAVKTALIDYLRSQTVFSDYNFDGSGLNILLDILSKNDNFMAFYMNMLASETTMDAVTRDGLLSQIKPLSYVPSSRRAGVANVAVVVTPPSNDVTSSLTLPRYTPFQSEPINGTNYTFMTLNSYSATKNLSSNTFTFPAVAISQGEHLGYNYPVVDSTLQTIYTIPSANIDTTTLLVTVQNSSIDTGQTVFTKNSDITSLDANSKVYFLQAGGDGNYEIYFGDGRLGKALSNGNIIITNYLVTQGEIANYANVFTSQSTIGGFSNIRVTTNASAAGGAEPETLDEIRFRAPLAYTRQNRIVTQTDYLNVIPVDYPNADQVAVWGGEDNDPPIYGSVFVSLKPKAGYVFSNAEKARIVAQVIRDRNMVTVTPVIVDPEYLYVLVTTKVYYDPDTTLKSDADIVQAVTTSIQSYNTSKLGSFNSTLAVSELQTAVDDTDTAIRNNDLSITIQKQFQPTLNVSQNYTFSFATEVHRGDLKHHLTTYPTFSIADDAGVAHDSYIEEIPQSYTGVESINMTAAGLSYTSTPTVTITGDGQGATAKATVQNGKVISIEVTNRGSGYSIATVTITGVGTGATAEAILSQRMGILRIYYYKDDGEKIVTNTNIGSIDYDTGQISLIGFDPISVATNPYYRTGILTFNTQPNDQTIVPVRNRITFIDTTNPLSIQVATETI